MKTPRPYPDSNSTNCMAYGIISMLRIMKKQFLDVLKSRVLTDCDLQSFLYKFFTL